MGFKCQRLEPARGIRQMAAAALQYLIAIRATDTVSRQVCIVRKRQPLPVFRYSKLGVGIPKVRHRALLSALGLLMASQAGSGVGQRDTTILLVL